MQPLRWSSGTNPSDPQHLHRVAARLTDDDLDFWVGLLRERGHLPHELSVLEREQNNRGRDHGAGPLFRSVNV